MKRSVFLFPFLLLLGWVPVLAQSTADGSMPAAENSFGQAIAVQDGHVFSGEPDLTHVPGVVYVFQQEADGSLSEIARLEADDGEVGNDFGASLAIEQSTLLVGAPGAEPHGAVYVFEQDAAGNWTQSARLAPEDTVQSFGRTLALTDQMAFVGAPASDEMHGSVHAFSREADGTWSFTEEIRGSAVEAEHLFGSAIAANGNHLLISSPGSERGTVYVFQHEEGSWTESQQLSPAQLNRGARFGTALHVHDGIALVGTPRQHGGTGGVITYELDGESGSWEASGQLMPFDGFGQALFGTAIAVDGSHAWIGAPGTASRMGAVYRYSRDAEEGTWSDATRLPFPDAQGGDRLGATVAADGQLAVSGLAGAAHGAGKIAVFAADDAGVWTAQATLEGDIDVGLSAITGEEIECEGGQIGEFDCDQVTLLSFLPSREIGGERGVRINDVWGWTDPQTGREIALVGRMDGMAFVDISEPTNPVYLGNLPLTEGARPNSWRDMKVYQDHMYVVADNAGEHGMQIFDLTQLRDVQNPPVEFTETAIYRNINSAHNMVINEETGYGYIVGASGGGETCGGGLHMINLENPAEPEFVGCFADPRTGRTGTGYTHDAQCVIYSGPDERYQGEEICFGANETAISIANVTDKNNPIAISIGSYPTYGYVHQGWLTEDQRYFFLSDELDELNNIVDNTRTLIWDVSNLEDPQLVREFMHETEASTHNFYILGDLMYQSNYTSGLRVFDITDPENPVEVAYFDTAPHQSGPGFAGSWGNYPFFESGTVVVTSGQEGVFFVRPEPRPPVSDAR